MKKILSYAFLLLCLQTVSAQNNWFTTYQDSVSLLTDATTIADNFKKEDTFFTYFYFQNIVKIPLK